MREKANNYLHIENTLKSHIFFSEKATNGENYFSGNQYFERLILWDRAQLASSSPAL